MSTTEAETKSSEVLESWEEIDEVQLDSTVNRLKEETMKSRIEEERLAAPAMVIQKPVVILRRPQNGTTSSSENNGQTGQKPKMQVKSLSQRQQEYAEARMRILGSMPDEEDVTSSIDINGSTNKTTTATRTSTGGEGNGLIFRR